MQKININPTKNDLKDLENTKINLLKLSISIKESIDRDLLLMESCHFPKTATMKRISNKKKDLKYIVKLINIINNLQKSHI